MRIFWTLLAGLVAGGILALWSATTPTEASPTPVPAAATPAAPVAALPPVEATRQPESPDTPIDAERSLVSEHTPMPAALLIPVADVGPQQLRDSFADGRGGSRVHEAIDILAPAGTPVLAAADGRIVKLFSSVPGGLTIYQFDPGETLAYYYAHLQRYADGLAEGQQVRRGDVIGYVGSSGNADPAAPHLHFAIFMLGPEKHWWQGTAVNPYPLLVSPGPRP
jgi:murein DD-endopeptidase MepM/ murein hydrolase activator NlpD